MFDVMERIDNWLAQETPVALATVIHTWGSAPRGIGAKMGITSDLGITGSVSGGCIEPAVIETALEILANEEPGRRLHFGVSDNTAWEVGLACGGEVDVFVEPLDRAWWQAVTAGLRANQPQTSALVVSGPYIGERVLITAAGTTHYTSPHLAEDSGNLEALQAAAHAALTERQTAHRTLGEMEVLLDVHLPRPRLVIVGGAHVAVTLHALAQQMGFAVILVDPRRAFATPERFPTVDHIYHTYPQHVFDDIGLDRDTYLVVLTHDPKIDDPALITALQTDIPYVGVMSSSRTHAQRVARLKGAGLGEAQLTRIHAPIGLDINAQTPEEIALCIMAEIVAVRNGVGT